MYRSALLCFPTFCHVVLLKYNVPLFKKKKKKSKGSQTVDFCITITSLCGYIFV